MILTGKEIIDIVSLLGLDLDGNQINDDVLETEISISESENNGQKYAHFTEYPEEGAMALG